MDIIFLLAAILLIPIIPAYILYKTLPTTAKVKGPFKGLQINLSGSFAGYFPLVIVSSGFVLQDIIKEREQFEIWRITGKIKSESLFEATGIILEIIPPESDFKIGSDGRFSMNVLVKPGHIKGVKQFPSLIFRKSKFKSIMVNLERTDYIKDEKRKTIDLSEDLVFETLPSEMSDPQSIRD